jgi:hypothetical protein
LGPMGTVVAAIVATTALPDTSAARAGASMAHAVPSTYCPGRLRLYHLCGSW